MSSVDNETTVLPTEFRGRVLIIFNSKNGQAPKYINGCRYYEIPENGILCTQFSPNDGVMKDFKKKFKVLISNKNGILEEIPIRNELRGTPSNLNLQVYDFKRGDINGIEFFSFVIDDFNLSYRESWDDYIDSAILNCP
jgi:hypothetical protein